MTDKPTDEALENLFVEETGFDIDDFPAAIFDFARAVLAKWGQPAQAAEPVAVVVPCYTPSGKRVALCSAKQDLPIGTKLYAAPRTSPTAPATQQPEGDVVAYLDVGANGYLDLGSELSEDALQQLPKGRHALVIAGTYGIDGYVAAPQPSYTAQAHQLAVVEPLYLAPQPQPVARESLTPEQIATAGEIEDNDSAFLAGFSTGVRFAEQHHGIKGGQHDHQDSRHRKGRH